jgi:hypothetical protein
MLIRSSRAPAVETAAVPLLFEAGTPATGEFTCAGCGYGVAVRTLLPVCPMCRGRMWEPPASALDGRAPF